MQFDGGSSAASVAPCWLAVHGAPNKDRLCCRKYQSQYHIQYKHTSSYTPCFHSSCIHSSRACLFPLSGLIAGALQNVHLITYTLSKQNAILLVAMNAGM